MSASLIRRGLELFSDKDGVKRSSAHRSALMQRVSSDKQGVQRRIRQLQRPGGAARSTTTVKDKHIRSALDVYRKKRKRSNNYGKNLDYFRCKANKTQSSHAAQVRPPPPVPKKPDQRGKNSPARRSCDFSPTCEDYPEIQRVPWASPVIPPHPAPSEPVRTDPSDSCSSSDVPLDQHLYEDISELLDGHQVRPPPPVPKKPDQRGKNSPARRSCDFSPTCEDYPEIQRVPWASPVIPPHPAPSEPVRTDPSDSCSSSDVPLDQHLYEDISELLDGHQVDSDGSSMFGQLARVPCSLLLPIMADGSRLRPTANGGDSSAPSRMTATPPQPRRPAVSLSIPPATHSSQPPRASMAADSAQPCSMAPWISHSGEGSMTSFHPGLSIKAPLYASDAPPLFAQTVHRIRSGIQLYQHVLFQRGTSMMNYITQLNCIADKLDKTVKNTRIAGITGGTTGAIGTAAIVAGIALAPVTFGASLAVSGIGVGVAAAGGVTGASAAIRKKVKKTQDRKKVEKILRNYQSQMEDIEECLKFIITGMKHLRRFERSGIAVGDDAVDVVRLAEQIENCDVIDTLSENTRAVQAFASDLDSYVTKEDAQRLKKDSQSPFAAKVREVALKLKENIDQLIRIKNMFR
ncbi:Apolipoprotein L domain-containing protein 1 [Anabarilius grahami]|uniref:Apolipoprotein L domain-containing protein 1 n=1 Tax=Anabarilius grahami TaxID=495550 RepID=A0A3N0Y736_ANAGA|nr:Apolipoprotein L domain-containing protein 1 [Anabarilius grahami]